MHIYIALKFAILYVTTRYSSKVWGYYVCTGIIISIRIGIFHLLTMNRNVLYVILYLYLYIISSNGRLGKSIQIHNDIQQLSIKMILLLG